MLQLDEFEGLAQKYRNKEYLVLNSKIFVFATNVGKRQIRGRVFQI